MRRVLRVPLCSSNCFCFPASFLFLRHIFPRRVGGGEVEVRGGGVSGQAGDASGGTCGHGMCCFWLCRRTHSAGQWHSPAPVGHCVPEESTHWPGQAHPWVSHYQ